MFTVILIVLFGAAIVIASGRAQRPEVDSRLTWILFGGYVLRLAVSPWTHTVSVFSTPSGIDSAGYERLGEVIARLWSYTGVHYVTSGELPELQNVALPPNLFAVVAYLNGEPSHLGCVALVAAAATFVCLDLHLVSLMLGARRGVALATTALMACLPSFLYYTSDTYKDGLVAFFVLGIFSSSVALARKFSPLRLGWAVLLLLGLWQTRFYLAFVMPAPLVLSLLGLRSGSVMRTLLAGLVIAGSLVTVYAYSDLASVVTENAVHTFRRGTAVEVINANSESGSGVNLGTGSTSFLPKLAYTLFAPFPWQSGSLGLQVEKIEVFIWYYFFYRAVGAARVLWRERRSDLILFVSFVVPTTVAYAFSFANIGLIVRERMGIVLGTIALATASWPARGALSSGALGSGRASPAAGEAVRRLELGARAHRLPGLPGR